MFVRFGVCVDEENLYLWGKRSIKAEERVCEIEVGGSTDGRNDDDSFRPFFRWAYFNKRRGTVARLHRLVIGESNIGSIFCGALSKYVNVRLDDKANRVFLGRQHAVLNTVHRRRLKIARFDVEEG